MKKSKRTDDPFQNLENQKLNNPIKNEILEKAKELQELKEKMSDETKLFNINQELKKLKKQNSIISKLKRKFL